VCREVWSAVFQRPAKAKENAMSGKLLDAVLVTGWLIVFLVVAMVHPGLANGVIAWVGALLLGWYNSVVRHDPKDDSLRPRWRTAAARPE
jgi:hypothetical protein